MTTAVIFGGSGFIGCHFAVHLLDNHIVSDVVLVDIRPIDKCQMTDSMSSYFSSGNIRYEESDVRKKIDIGDSKVDLIANFAAIHREPGHTDEEYFATNIRGAENICNWAENIGCNKMIFTSSIAPYGPTEDPKDEGSLPVPVTPYGASKLVAEKIHISWQKADQNNRKLVIVRPGVVFGPGEGGNVTRLIKAVLGRYFLYIGNKKTIKAGIYVKELCHAMTWVLKKQEDSNEKISLFNMTMNPAPTVAEYVETICKVAGVERLFPSVPFTLMHISSYIIELFANLLRVNQPISPVRIRKLVRSNNIIPAYLESHGYEYQFTLQSAFEDWKKDNSFDWE